MSLLTFLVRRVLHSVFVLLGLSLVIFVIARVMPGDPARMAVGARGRDILMQFLVEAVTLTGVGGALGIGFGLGAAFLARAAFDFQAAAPLWSVLLGFGVSSAVGLIFGIYPAILASKQDPIVALRHD